MYAVSFDLVCVFIVQPARTKLHVVHCSWLRPKAVFRQIKCDVSLFIFIAEPEPISAAVVLTLLDIKKR